MRIWYSIPGFKLYVITKTGIVKSIATGKKLKGGLCGSGYWNYHLIQDNGKPIVIGRHRLIALTFIPNDVPERAFVNHIDGDKTNDAIENLEWCTHLENMIHAGRLGLTAKRLAITARNPVTNEVIFFNTIKEAGVHTGIKKDPMRFRYWKFNGKVFPEGWQYMKGEYTGEWETPDDIEAAKRDMADYLSARKPVLVRNLNTGVITQYPCIADVARLLGMRRPTLAAKIRALTTPVFPPGLQVKFDDGTPWPEPDDLQKEYKRSLGMIMVVAEHAETGEKRQFNTLKEAMVGLNMTKATLLSRFKYGKKKTVDGYYYYHLV